MIIFFFFNSFKSIKIDNKTNKTKNTGTTFYDPGQFLANGGSFEMPQSSSIYYFYFCSDLPIAVEEVVNCDSDSSICAVDSTTEVATSMATFADMSYAPKDNYQEGLTINFTHVDVNTKAECVCKFFKKQRNCDLFNLFIYF